jgi:hypothetical protein
VTISETENVSDHRHDRKSSTVVAPAIEPSFRVSTLEPQYSIEVLPSRIVERVFEDFELLHETEMLKVWRHLKDESMFDVEQNLATVAVVLDQNVQRIGALDPSEQTRVWRKGNDGILDDREVTLERFRILLEKSVDETEELHDSLILSKILVTYKANR